MSGTRGDKGARGDKGEQGDQGYQGDRGDRGTRGDQGDRGTRGQSGRVRIVTKWRPSALAVAAILSVFVFMVMVTWLTVVRGR